MPFSAHDRPRLLHRLQAESFDLLVIGGGITGAGIALDAAARGLKTALIEKNDFASGTSSRSTKLIHGGLRYLKQLEFALVKEVGSERAVVHALAPHLVVPEKMLLPLYDRRGLGYWLTSVGLKVYDWLAGVMPEEQRRMLTRPQTLRYEPLLNNEGVKGGAIYAEYRTDDARLTLEIVKEAVQQGACPLNYVEAVGLHPGSDCTTVAARERMADQIFHISAKAVVNATGPWVDELRELDKSKTGKHLHLTKGVHIVVPYHRLPVRQAIYFDGRDGRMIFAIPRGRITYIGTTDTDYSGSKDEVYTTHEDARYLLHAVNETFPASLLTLADIESSWAGLRPLIFEAGKSASELSRRDEIFESPSGLISIAGGKLTGYRKMAERVVNKVIEKHFQDRVLRPCPTATLTLPGGKFPAHQPVRQLQTEIAERLDALNVRGHEALDLVHLYGQQARTLVERMEKQRSGLPELDLLLAKAWFAIEYEMALTPLDFAIRRSGLLYFNRPELARWSEPILRYFAEAFSWSPARTETERHNLHRELQAVIHFHHAEG